MSTTLELDLSPLSPLARELAATIAHVASDIALVIDADGVIATVAAGAAVQEHGCNQWVGQHWIDTVSASTRPKIQSLMDEVASSGRAARRREVNHLSQIGDELPVTWSAIRLGADGPVLAVGRDLRAIAAIQQRFVEAQQDMERQYWSRRQAETRYRLLFQVANDAVLLIDADSQCVLAANPASEELLGVPPTVMQGKALTDSLPQSARAKVAELLTTARSTGRAVEIRLRALSTGGMLEFSATPFRFEDERQLLVRARHGPAAGTGEDSLAFSRMAEFVETMLEAVVITDSSGGVLMANQAFLRLTRQANDTSVRGRALPDLLLDTEGGWATLVSRVLATGLISKAALQVGSLDGQPLSVQVSATLLAEGEQTCLGFVLRIDRRLPQDTAGGDVMAGLLGQVGRVPLADLLVEVTHRAERQLIESALLRTGGLRAAAADALGMTPEALDLRIQRHGLSSLGYADDAAATPPLIN